MESDQATFECNASGGVQCTPPVKLPITSGVTETVTVSYTTIASPGAASLEFIATADSAGHADTAQVSLDLIPRMELTASSPPTSTALQYGEYSASYDLKNNDPAPQSFVITCNWSPDDCTLGPDSLQVAGGATAPISLTFDAGAVPDTYPLDVTAVGNNASETVSATVTVAEYTPVTVNGTREPFFVEPLSAGTEDWFEVRFPGQDSTAFSISVVCPGSGGVSCDPTSVTYQVGDAPVPIPVTFTGGVSGNTSTVTVTATLVTNAEITASADLTVVSSDEIIVDLDSANPGLEFLTSECLNASAGPGAIVCDAFQYVYPFTAVTRLNRAHQLGLIYNDRLIRPHGVVGVDVTLPAGVAEPDKLDIQLTIGSSSDTRSYPASTYEPGVPIRFSFDWNEGVSTGTELIDYQVAVTPWIGGVPQPQVTASGKLISQDKAYEFGRGWWLAGYENLVARTDADLGDILIWTGGDASARVYSKVPGVDSVYVPESTRMRPDTILELNDGTFVRRLIGGGEVRFDSDGFHTTTTDRNGNQTEFTHSTDGDWYVPTSLIVTTPAGGETVYELDYKNNTGELATVGVVNADGSGWDEYTFTTSRPGNPGQNKVPFQITSIQAPDGLTTQFSYVDATGPLSTMTDAGGVVTQVSRLSQRVTEVRVMTDSLPDVVFGYRPGSLVGQSNISTDEYAPRMADSVGAVFDGPRAVSDTTRFYLTGWGALKGIEDALGAATWIDRKDSVFPGLPTRVRYPNGRQVDAAYTVEGLLDFTLDHATRAVTDYAWDETHSRPDTIVSAEGVRRIFSYDANGNRLSEQVGNGPPTTYAYDGLGLLVRIQDGLANRDTLVYDTRGNLESRESPLGHTTSYERDGLGRVTRTLQPIDGSDQLTTELTYDVMGRVLIEEKTTSVDSMWTRVHTAYDSIGRRISARAFGDTTKVLQDSLSTGLQAWEYDELGRVVVERSSQKQDTMMYDLAGNVTEIRTSRGHTISMQYDELGRLKERIVPPVSYGTHNGELAPFPYYSSGLTIPGDTVTFTYDEMGNTLTVDNRYAQITRTYTPDGLILSDEQAIRDYTGAEDFSNLVYDLRYAYDRDRRRVSLEHPAGLVGGTGRTGYQYDDRGRVVTITDPLGEAYGYEYDDAGRIKARTFPGSGSGGGVSYTYDDDNRLTDHVLRVAADTLLRANMTRRANGTVDDVGGNATSDITYSGLGAVTSTVGLAWEGDWSFERFETDPFGAQRRSVTIGGEAGADSVAYRNTVDASGRVASKVQEWRSSEGSTAPSEWEPGWTDYQFVGSNRDYSQSRSFKWDITGNPPNLLMAEKVVTFREESKGFYSADDQLMVYQVNRDSIVHDTTAAVVSLLTSLPHRFSRPCPTPPVTS